MDFHPSLLSFGPGGWGLILLRGLLITVSLALATLPFGLTLGLVVALGRHSKGRWRSRLATLYTTVFRGIPELLTLYLVAFGAQRYFQKAWAAFGFEGTPELPPFITAMIALGVVLAAFSSEVWLGALNAIPKGQIEAGKAVGLNSRKIFALVVFPQLVRIALPGLGNNWMVLLKDTSLASVITLPEFMYVTARGNTMTKEPFLFFGFACLVYLILSLLSMTGIGRLESFANRGQEAR
jgi:polar amino acid transport system permease protein